MLRTHRSVRSGDLGTWGLGDEAIGKTEGSPRHPVTPSPRHLVSPSPRHLVTSQPDSRDVELLQENHRWGNQGDVEDYSFETDIYNY